MTAQNPTHADALTTLLALTDLLTPYAIRAAVSLDLPRLIAAGLRTPEALAERCGADLRALSSLAAYLAHKGVFEETEEGLSLTPVGQLLTFEPSRIMLSAGGAGDHLHRAWPGLAHAVRTRTSGYEAVFGRDLWSTLSDDPALSESFDRYMENWGERWIPAAVAARDWLADGHIVDVGGGAGQLVGALLQANPTLEGSVVDLPAAADRARKAFAGAGLASRAQVFEASFFDRLPAHGDLYILAQVLHDWPDEPALAILQRCAQAAGPNGKVLIVERVMSDPPSAEHLAADLFMLVLFGAKERTLAEFGALASGAGLAITGTQDIGFGLSALELRSAA